MPESEKVREFIVGWSKYLALSRVYSADIPG